MLNCACSEAPGHWLQVSGLILDISLLLQAQACKERCVKCNAAGKDYSSLLPLVHREASINGALMRSSAGHQTPALQPTMTSLQPRAARYLPMHPVTFCRTDCLLCICHSSTKPSSVIYCSHKSACMAYALPLLAHALRGSLLKRLWDSSEPAAADADG